jgi:uncharacterized protein (DUF2062 family)
MLIRKIKDIFENAVASGSDSPHRLTIAFCLGMYVAFSPFPGFHMLMLVSARWLWGLNFPVMFVAATLNNLWTMGPIYGADYFVGHWFVHTFLRINSTWTISLEKILGNASICLPSFFIGGNLLGIALAFACYIPMFKLFNTLWFKQNSKVADENYNQK